MASDTPASDLLALIRFLLLEADDVTGSVSDRIGGPFAPRSGEELRETLFPRIVVDIIGGSLLSSGAIYSPIVHVYVYSRSSAGDAVRILDSVSKALRQARLYRQGIGTRGVIAQSESGLTGFNKDLRAHFARATFRANMTGLSAPS